MCKYYSGRKTDSYNKNTKNEPEKISRTFNETPCILFQVNDFRYCVKVS